MNTRAFERIFIIVFENQLRSTVIENDYMRNLATRGVDLSNYFGIMHPSQPNYLAAIGGLPFTKGDGPVDLGETCIVDLLEAKGITWKAYMENLPVGDSEAAKSVEVSADGLYFRKHNPFVSFNQVRKAPNRLAKIVDAHELKTDLDSGTLPQYCWYTPNIQNDGHSPPQEGSRTDEINFLSRYLHDFLEPLLANPAFMKGTLVVVTFDESYPHEDNHVYTVLLGDMVRAHTVRPERYDHYSLLRTVEENFDLGTLGRNDAVATFFGFLWGQPAELVTWEDHR